MFRDKPLRNLTDKNVEGAETGTKVSEADMTKRIEILSQQDKHKILTREAYELLSHSKPLVNKEDSVFNKFPFATQGLLSHLVEDLPIWSMTQ